MEPFGAEIVKSALFAPKSLFGPKSAFWARKSFLGPKSDVGAKIIFHDFSPKLLHLSLVLKVFGAKCKNDAFYVKISKNVKNL